MIDVEALLTDARVQVTENGGRNYGWHGRLVGRLIAAIEQLQTENTKLREEIEAYRVAEKNLKARIKRLE